LDRRAYASLTSARVRTHPRPECLRLLLMLCPHSAWSGRSPAQIDRTAVAFDRAVSSTISADDETIYAYEDSAVFSFRRAKELGIGTVYELPAAHFEETQCLLQREVARDATLKPFLQALHEPEIKLMRKEQEIKLADTIVCPSSFVRNSVAAKANPEAQIVVIPYGADVSQPPKTWTQSSLDGPLKLVYAGSLGPQKGLHVLFQALESLPASSYQLTLAGRWVPGFQKWLSRRSKINYRHVGQVRHNNIQTLFRNNQVLILPSLCDGFGLILLEAMASGIPVIATDRTGAPDIVTPGVDGDVVPAGDPGALARALEAYLHDRHSLAAKGAHARKTAERLSWQAYRRRLTASIYSSVPEPAYH